MAGTRYYDSDIKQLEEVCICGGQAKTLYVETERIVENEYTAEYKIHVLKVIKCLTCNSTSVIQYVGYGREDLDEHYGAEESRNYRRKSLMAPKKHYDEAIPWQVSNVLNEANAVVGISPRSSIGLCRSILEEVCSDFGIPKKREKGGYHSLNKRLELLSDLNQWEIHLREVTRVIRALGNETTHGEHDDLSKKLHYDDALTVLGLVEYALDRLYVVPMRQQTIEKNMAVLSEKLLDSSDAVADSRRKQDNGPE